MTIRIHEIYRSVQGESSFAGQPCTFVRTTACDLRCVWCDTPDAFTGGTVMTIDAVMQQVNQLGCDLVELTGGEPLLQPKLPALCSELLASGATVLIETGGHRDISVLPAGVIRIMDIKCPGSGESQHNLWSNISHLNKRDEVKFVIADRSDFDWAVSVVQQHGLADRVGGLLFSPVHGALSPVELSQWLLESKIPARLNLQLHKYIWGAEATGV